MGRCERLKWNRRKLGMSQEELGKKVGVSANTISRLERDETAWANMKDSTTDGVYNTLRDLASWQCDIHSIFKDNATEDDIRELRKKVRDKRQELGMSQKELGMMLGLNYTTIYNYEKHDKAWKGKRSTVPSKLMEFLNGEYDTVKNVEGPVEEEPAIMETQIEEKVTDITESTDGIGYTLTTTETRTLETAPKESEEDEILRTFNSVVGILQDKLTEPNLNEISRKAYISMIAGVCNGYLEHQ